MKFRSRFYGISSDTKSRLSLDGPGTPCSQKLRSTNVHRLKLYFRHDPHFALCLDLRQEYTGQGQSEIFFLEPPLSA